MEFTHWLVPLLLTGCALLTLRRGSDPYEALIAGAGEGLSVIPRILPALIALLTATKMLRESGFFELLVGVIGGALAALGVDAALLPLIMLQPFSGSGSLAIAGEIMAESGGESAVAKTAAVLLGSSETTFYTLSVYFAAAGVKNGRYAAKAALIGDFFGALAAIWAAKIFF